MIVLSLLSSAFTKPLLRYFYGRLYDLFSFFICSCHSLKKKIFLLLFYLVFVWYFSLYLIKNHSDFLSVNLKLLRLFQSWFNRMSLSSSGSSLLNLVLKITGCLKIQALFLMIIFFGFLKNWKYQFHHIFSLLHLIFFHTKFLLDWVCFH